MRFDSTDAGNKLLDEGQYNFSVAQCEDCTSKFNDGEQQIKLSLRIFHDGGTVFLNQWLSPSKTWKIKQFAMATGLMDKFETNEIMAVDCEGRAGKLSIGSYTDGNGIKRNSVFKYIESDEPVKQALKEFRATKKEQSELPEDMPF